MTRDSIQEYTEAVRWQYLRATKKEKERILDEFTQVTGYYRKSAVRLLRWGKQSSPVKRRGRPRCYGAPVVQALKVAWEATDRLCSRRLHPLLPFLSPILSPS